MSNNSLSFVHVQPFSYILALSWKHNGEFQLLDVKSPSSYIWSG